MAKHYKIHPAIGIARVGTSSEYFLGAELPGTYAKPADGHYRDASGRLRRQAVRFRVFEYDDTNPATPPIEVTAGQGGVMAVQWTVHLANKKAIWHSFNGLTGEQTPYPPGDLRNSGITDAQERRKRLIIDPGARTISGANQNGEVNRNSSTNPANEKWPPTLNPSTSIDSLGTLATDQAGRLIVAGGFGKSGTTGTPQSTLNFANNDGWFDDVSDGPVTARVRFASGVEIEASGKAWVIVAPPDYAPPIENIVSIYDLLYDLALRKFGADASIFDAASQTWQAGFQPSFSRHIYAILHKAFDYRWVNQGANTHSPAHFDWALLGQAPQPGETPATNPRARIFNRLRNPNDLDPTSTTRTMPKLKSDGTGGMVQESPTFAITKTQYEFLRRWSNGQFLADWTGQPPSPETVISPAGLDRAALEAGCGGAFFPGMEASWNLRNTNLYVTPFEFRLRHAENENDTAGVMEGDVTKRSALPWQADFLQCADNWWPAQRPNQVRASPTATGPVNWSQGIGNELDMVERWWKLGVVRPSSTPGSVAKFHQDERIL
ncbi:LodA/GoxA family CTQ-dependent oxidase [uncultured Paludibaculum sp.]|uniref:LodA/GoxA family CTQ-dependent oxidase n=1 Tax=uncultured Paludibaculum sp. TaxID=1765020 RepID=UPI002AAB1DFA|nr:LodA/GoxA family CTQ-dependent oxidase [uncultured Paludibaculum sp.]